MVLSELDSYEVEKAKKEASMSLQDYYNASVEHERSAVKNKQESFIGNFSCSDAKKMFESSINEAVSFICSEVMKSVANGSKSCQIPLDKVFAITHPKNISNVKRKLIELGYTVEVIWGAELVVKGWTE